MAEAQIIEKRRQASPAVTPQALAWDGKKKVLWVGSRDLRRIYAIDAESWAVVEEREAPGIPWAAVAINGEVRFTIGEGADDDRYVYRYRSSTKTGMLSVRSTWVPKSAVTRLSIARSTCCMDGNNQMRIGESPGSIRNRKRQKLKISLSSRLRVAHLLPMANSFGLIIARKTGLFRSPFQVEGPC